MVPSDFGSNPALSREGRDLGKWKLSPVFFG